MYRQRLHMRVGSQDHGPQEPEADGDGSRRTETWVCTSRRCQPTHPSGGLEGVGVPESLTRHQLPWRMSRTGPLGPKNPPAPSKEAGQAPPELPRERAEHSTAGPTNTHIPGGQKHPARSGDPGPDPPTLNAASNPQQTGMMPKRTTNRLIQPSYVSKTELLSFASRHLRRRCGGDIWTAERL